MAHIIGTDANFNSEVINTKGKVLVDFWATWCGPCQMLAPVLEEISTELGDKIKVVKVDVDTNPDTSGKFNVSSIPTVLLFVDGQVKETIIGFRQKKDYLDLIGKY